MRLSLPFALVIAGCAMTAPVPPAEAPLSLARAETAFAAQSVREGLRAAFLAWLAPGATVFRDGPVDGPAQVAREPDPPIVLDWRPAFVEVSASGEMGLSTGPWRITSRSDPGAPAKYGQFVSVWKRPPGGAWRVWLDIGITHPGPALWDVPLDAHANPAPIGAPAGTIAQAEADFARLAREGGHRAAYAAWASPTLRAYRGAHAPFLGREPSLSSPVAEGSALWTLDRHETSDAGDFGFTVGRLLSPKGLKAGDFVRVWRREGAHWRIALDVVSAVKPE